MTLQQAFEGILTELRKVVCGQEDALNQILTCLFSHGHCLLEGKPGLGKTLIARALARSLDATYKRVQFTPDLMPSDVCGTNVYDRETASFRLAKGPIFTDVLLADEINRTPPKTQSALLEAMEERHVTIDGITHLLSPQFFVIATQNPLEYEGTYPLPEAQLDRFCMKVVLDYPDRDAERAVLSLHHRGFDPFQMSDSEVTARMGLDALAKAREEITQVTVEDGVMGYVLDLAEATRSNRDLVLGASTRAAIHLMTASKVSAASKGRDFVIPDDVKEMALPVLRHRLQLRPEAELSGETPDRLIARILDGLKVPR